MTQPTRTCPPPTPWNQIKVGDRIEYQRERDLFMHHAIVSGTSKNKIMLQDEKNPLVEHTCYVRVITPAETTGNPPQTTPPADQAPASKPSKVDKMKKQHEAARRVITFTPDQLAHRRRFCELVNLKISLGTPKDAAVRAILKRPEFMDLTARHGQPVTAGTFDYWRHRFGMPLPPRQPPKTETTDTTEDGITTDSTSDSTSQTLFEAPDPMPIPDTTPEAPPQPEVTEPEATEPEAQDLPPSAVIASFLKRTHDAERVLTAARLIVRIIRTL